MERISTVSVLSIVTLVGCQSAVELHYDAPKKGAADIVKQAQDGYSYFVMSTNYILVSPATSSNAGQHTGKVTGSSDPVASKTDESKDSNNKGSNASGTKPRNNTLASTTSPQTARQAQKAGSTGAGSNQTTSSTNKRQQNTTTAQTSTNTTPPELDNPLATTTIDGQSWTAKVVPMPDPEQALMVRGTSGFWKSTTVSIAHYQNTDLASSINVTAQNLVPTRIGQIGGAIASLVSIAGITGVSGGVEPTKLQAFYFKVPPTKESKGIDDYWTYDFAFDPPDQPAGTVTLDEFKQLTANGKTVNFWPVPACRNAVLTVTNEKLHMKKMGYRFQLVAASSDILRLQPLPLSGKVDLGTVCGSSTNGSTGSDALGNATDDLTALQKAIQQIRDAKKQPSSKPATTSSPKPQ